LTHSLPFGTPPNLGGEQGAGEKMVATLKIVEKLNSKIIEKFFVQSSYDFEPDRATQ
jgi:hypothetical protein